MPHYLIRWQFKDATAKSLVDKPQNRTAPARKLIEGFDGQLLCYYFALGEYDGLAICEFPDTVSVAACSMKAAATGAFARFETMALLTATEAKEAMKKAKKAKVDYTAPNADSGEVTRSFRDHARHSGLISPA
jgi:uncharacterized protein with GYD domain